MGNNYSYTPLHKYNINLLQRNKYMDKKLTYDELLNIANNAKPVKREVKMTNITDETDRLLFRAKNHIARYNRRKEEV
jgi:hypothetical protein